MKKLELNINLNIKTVILSFFVASFVVFGSLGSLKVAAVESVATSYNPDIAAKLTSRCDSVRDYLSQTVRINELAARQNKVRGWEYLLRQLDNIKLNYTKFGVSYTELAVNTKSLKQQLEQFKADFEAYDAEFQRLNGIDCFKQPEAFWRQLEKVRSFRSGVALAADNYNARLSGVLTKEAEKW